MFSLRCTGETLTVVVRPIIKDFFYPELSYERLISYNADSCPEKVRFRKECTMHTLNSSVNTENSLEILSQTTVLEKDFTVYGTAEEPLFLAKDVAEMIDYAWKDNRKTYRDISKMIQTVDEDEKLKCCGKNLPTNKETWFLTENGLYEVLMQSTKPIAKSFKKQVKKLLHELRVGKVVVKEVVKEIDPVKEKEIGLERARLLREIAAEYDGNSKTWKQVLDAHATREIAGEFLLPLPEVTEKGKTAEMIGKPYGLSCQKIGAIIKKIGLQKTDENGFVRVNKAKGCNREVETFYWNDDAAKKIEDAILAETADKIMDKMGV